MVGLQFAKYSLSLIYVLAKALSIVDGIEQIHKSILENELLSLLYPRA